MLDKSVDGALLALRKSIIRGHGAGRAEVEALLAMRGVATPRVVPSKSDDAAHRGQMKRLVVEALQSGPATGPDVAVYVAARRPELAPYVAHKRTAQTLSRLKRNGLLVWEDRMGRWEWRLA